MLTVPEGTAYLSWHKFHGSFPATNKVRWLEQVGRSSTGLTAARASAKFFRNPDTPLTVPRDIYAATESVVEVQIVSFASGVREVFTTNLQNPRAYYGTQDIPGDFGLVYAVHNHPRCDLAIHGISVHDDYVYVLYSAAFGAMSCDERQPFFPPSTSYERWQVPTDIYQHDMSAFVARAFFGTISTQTVTPGPTGDNVAPTDEDAQQLLADRRGWCHPVMARLVRVGASWEVDDVTPLALKPVPGYGYVSRRSTTYDGVNTTVTDYKFVQYESALQALAQLRSVVGLTFETPIGPAVYWLNGRCDWQYTPLDPAYPLVENDGDSATQYIWADATLPLRAASPAAGNNLWIGLWTDTFGTADSHDLGVHASLDGPAFGTHPLQLDQPVYKDGKVYVLCRRIRQRRGDDAGATHVAVVSPPQYNELNEKVAEASLEVWDVGIAPERVGRLNVEHGVLTFTAYTDNKLWLMGIDGTLTSDKVRRLLEIKGADSALYLYKLLLSNGGSATTGPNYGTVPLIHLEAAPALHSE